jgi:glycosyltransferase involved in cell wall biosynthesis
MVASQSNLVDRIPGLVSVVIPAFNAQKSVRRAIDSALNQTYPHVEVIVVNDGSTDETEAIVRGYGERVRYVRQENAGETAARNRGFSMARGEFITLVDHDDWWEPQFVQTCVAFLNEHPQAVAVSTAHDHQTALKEGVQTRPAYLSNGAAPSPSKPREPIVLQRFFDFWHEHDHICAGSAMLRGSLIDAAGGQRTDLVLSGDMEYWAYLATFGKWGFIPQILLHVDGTQIARGKLYEKFYNRFRRVASVESWEKRIIGRLDPADRAGFERVRGRVANGYVFAKVFVGNDREARDTARAYAKDLEGKFGKLWRAGLTAGVLSWAPLCRIVRMRTRVQYYLAGRKL